jgi:hypothetical protein
MKPEDHKDNELLDENGEPRLPGHNSKGEYSTAQMLWDEIYGGDTSQPLFD